MNEKLSKLQSLYAELDKFQASGEDVVADVRAEINNLELQYLKEVVLPRISKPLGNCLSGLRCSIDFSIQFDGEKTLDYSVCTSGSTMLIRDKVECIPDTVMDCILEDAPTLLSTETKQTSEPLASNVRIVDYSEKAVAVYGDTKQLADTFRSMGGYFNARLREGVGWVFSKRKRDELEAILKPYQVTKHVIPEKAIPSSPVVSSVARQTEKGNPHDYNEWIDMVLSMRCMPNNGFTAPHKAIFLLTIIESIRCNYLKNNKVYPTKRLEEIFCRLWNKYVPKDWPFTMNFYQPYMHLSGENFMIL